MLNSSLIYNIVINALIVFEDNLQVFWGGRYYEFMD